MVGFTESRLSGLIKNVHIFPSQSISILSTSQLKIQFLFIRRITVIVKQNLSVHMTICYSDVKYQNYRLQIQVLDFVSDDLWPFSIVKTTGPTNLQHTITLSHTQLHKHVKQTAHDTTEPHPAT